MRLNEGVEACDSSELIERLVTLNAEELAGLTKPYIIVIGGD